MSPRFRKIAQPAAAVRVLGLSQAYWAIGGGGLLRDGGIVVLTLVVTEKRMRKSLSIAYFAILERDLKSRNRTFVSTPLPRYMRGGREGPCFFTQSKFSLLFLRVFRTAPFTLGVASEEPKAVYGPQT